MEKKIILIVDKSQSCLFLAVGSKPRYLISGSSLSQGSLKTETDWMKGLERRGWDGGGRVGEGQQRE